MAVLRPFEQIDAGGVDSRSNPINMPRNRALRCLNWVPRQAGFWEQRWGYSTVTMSTVTASPIHSMFPYRTWNGNKFVLFMSNDKTLKVLDTATNTVTTPALRGTAIASTAKGNGFFANNRFHYGNGTDQKWFDGSTWRDSGLPQLDAIANLSGITVVEGTRELKAAEASSVTLTAVAGGSFPQDLTGRLIYIALFGLSGIDAAGELGPATIFAGSGRVLVGLNNKITVSNMPSFTSGLQKLLAGTDDGGNLAYFFTNKTLNINSCTRSGTTQTIDVSATNHGLSQNDVVIVAGTTSFDGVYFVLQVVDSNTFSIVVPGTNLNANTGAVGTASRIVTAGNAATSIDILADTRDKSYQVNQDLGLPASTVGGSNPGFQFYGSIYNPSTGHVGNRVAIGGRALQTAYRSNWHITNLPNFLGQDSEWRILIGRTGDGAQVPYVCADNAVNWLFTRPAGFSGSLLQTALIVSDSQIDGAHEMPSRNGIIPSQCNMFCLAADFAYAADPGSPFLRRSGDLSQASERGDTFTGRPEQSWAPDDVDTFPTAEALTGIFEVDQEVFCGTLHDCAVSTNLAGIPQWVGPWNVGIAGPRAGTKCGSHGFYWLSGDKQLCTLEQGVPVVISEEYEAAELFQIGDQYLNSVELVYYRNAAKQKDELRIEVQLTDGTPYTIIHDFRLREVFTAPGSLYGQGYSSQFQGALATSFTSAAVRDATGALQVYSGASTGQIYQIYSGADDAGNQYNSDLILLVNGGTNRPSVPFIDWYGDGQIDVSKGQTLSTSLAATSEFSFEDVTPSSNPAQTVPGSENDFLFRAYFEHPEVQHVYIRFQLTSHSADGNLELNSPPHVPLESYGRLYEIIPSVGDERER